MILSACEVNSEAETIPLLSREHTSTNKRFRHSVFVVDLIREGRGTLPENGMKYEK
jgi:hypothetical protein